MDNRDKTKDCKNGQRTPKLKPNLIVLIQC